MLAQKLTEKAAWTYRETLKISGRVPEMRVASSLSCVEIFTALYYGDLIKFNPTSPFDPARDRCIVSKGHGSICLYPIFADLGFFPTEELDRVCKAGSFLGCIPDPAIPGYETVNGSLGHGVGVGSGMALGLKNTDRPQDVMVITGDGELQEGSNWEAFSFASHHKLDNLNIIIDNNRISMLGFTADAMSFGSLRLRLESFGLDVDEVDGHDVMATHAAIASMKAKKNGKPKALIANTIKGRGVPSLENKPLCHVTAVSQQTVREIIGEDA